MRGLKIGSVRGIEPLTPPAIPPRPTSWRTGIPTISLSGRVERKLAHPNSTICLYTKAKVKALVIHPRDETEQSLNSRGFMYRRAMAHLEHDV
ncbi:MAG: hypothetical protein RID09_24455 [Coleofasciculus sp. G1-WW12-02]|uniref:hypothetical protein n=1 Tax=unclassified Coleofasciculus TaxID=2692782 RepID=UPI0032F59A11